jgi:hypothetical protein
MNGISLSRLPLAAKVWCTLFLVGIGCGCIAALTQAATTVGVSAGEVRARLGQEPSMTHIGVHEHSAEREIRLEEVHDTERMRIETPLLIQTSHTHLFGQTLIAGLLGLIFLFSSLAEARKAAILSLPFVGTLLDIGGMWLTRFVWGPFATLVIIGGSTFALGYALIAIISLYELWLAKEA